MVKDSNRNEVLYYFSYSLHSGPILQQTVDHLHLSYLSTGSRQPCRIFLDDKTLLFIQEMHCLCSEGSISL